VAVCSQHAGHGACCGDFTRGWPSAHSKIQTSLGFGFVCACPWAFLACSCATWLPSLPPSGHCWVAPGAMMSFGVVWALLSLFGAAAVTAGLNCSSRRVSGGLNGVFAFPPCLALAVDDHSWLGWWRKPAQHPRPFT